MPLLEISNLATIQNTLCNNAGNHRTNLYHHRNFALLLIYATHLQKLDISNKENPSPEIQYER